MTLPSVNTIDFLNTPQRSGSFYPNDGLIDQLLRKIKFVPVPQAEFVEFSKAISLPTLTFIDRDAPLTNTPTELELTSETFFRYGDHIAMDQLNEIGSRGTNQLEQQVNAIKLAILRKLSTDLISGNGVTGLVGIDRQIGLGHGGGFNAANPFNLQDLYKGRYLSKTSDGFVGGYGGAYFVGNERALRLVLSAYDTVGKSIRWKYEQNLGTNLANICGIPWLVDNSIPINPTTDATTIYIVPLRGTTSISILYAKDPFHECDSFGIHCYSIPLKNNKQNQFMAVVGYYLLYVPEDILVRIRNVPLMGIP